MKICRIQVLGVFAISSAIAGFAQTTTSALVTPAPKPVAAPMLPYLAAFKTTRVQTLANGTTITYESSSIEARDRQGRHYIATAEAHHPNQPEITLFHISDPITGTETRWDSRRKRAVVYELPPQEQRHGCWRSDSQEMMYSYPLTPEQRTAENATETESPVVVTEQAPQPTRQKLGTDVIQGLQVHGERTTYTIPTGQIGNDQPIIRTSESWRSDAYLIQARWIQDDPRSGKTTRELTSFDPGEPDPSLFQPPSGYEVVTEPLHQVSCHQ